MQGKMDGYKWKDRAILFMSRMALLLSLISFAVPLSAAPLLPIQIAWLEIPVATDNLHKVTVYNLTEPAVELELVRPGRVPDMKLGISLISSQFGQGSVHAAVYRKLGVDDACGYLKAVWNDREPAKGILPDIRRAFGLDEQGAHGQFDGNGFRVFWLQREGAEGVEAYLLPCTRRNVVFLIDGMRDLEGLKEILSRARYRPPSPGHEQVGGR